MTPRLPAVAPVRKEVRGITVRATPDVVDGVMKNTGRSKLVVDERSEIAVWFGERAVDDDTAACGAIHFGCHFFSDLERGDTNVRTDRNYELRWIVG